MYGTAGRSTAANRRTAASKTQNLRNKLVNVPKSFYIALLSIIKIHKLI